MVLRLTCCLLTLFGGILILVTGIRYCRFSRSALASRSWLPTYPRLFALCLLFAALGYTAVLITLFCQPLDLFHLLLCGLLCFKGLCVAGLLQGNMRGAQSLYGEHRALEQALTQIEDKDNSFKQAVVRVKSVVQQGRLLHTVNEVATLLLGSHVTTFDKTLLECMTKVGDHLDVDRVYIWKNHLQGEELYCTQLYEWSGGADPQQGNDLTVSVPFPGNWYPTLSNNSCVNGIVKTFHDYERAHLEAQGIVSILVVPVFLHSTFWGFVGFDDCHNERIFSEDEESILRSVSLLFATSMLRNEMTANLMRTKEEALSNARAKTDFLAVMSHEIRTPINAITGMSNIARMTDNKEKITDCLNHIDVASRQLLLLINDILDMSKIEAGKLELASEPFVLASLLRNVKTITDVRAEEKKQSFTIELAQDLPEVLVGDEMRLSQVLLNLLSNAVKFTPKGGNIYLQAAQTSCSQEGYAALVLRVSDTGIGIESEDVDRIFSKFEQADRGTSRRFGGTGLGLSITRNIVALMGGDIEVSSKPGKGSQFTVRICLQQGSHEMLLPQTGTGANTQSFAGYRALLVEDIEINREIVADLLEHTGLEIDMAENGQVALEMFMAAPGRYNIILMDIHMPVKDGYTATRELRELDLPEARSIPIIAMTANAFSEDVQRCLEAGMNGHLAKPVDVEALTQTIEQHLGL